MSGFCSLFVQEINFVVRSHSFTSLVHLCASSFSVLSWLGNWWSPTKGIKKGLKKVWTMNLSPDQTRFRQTLDFTVYNCYWQFCLAVLPTLLHLKPKPLIKSTTLPKWNSDFTGILLLPKQVANVNNLTLILTTPCAFPVTAIFLYTQRTQPLFKWSTKGGLTNSI